jgi:hypothetical protein
VGGNLSPQRALASGQQTVPLGGFLLEGQRDGQTILPSAAYSLPDKITVYFGWRPIDLLAADPYIDHDRQASF